MKYAKRRSASVRVGAFGVAIVLTLCGCTTGRWFETRPQQQGDTALPPPSSSADLKSSTVTYIRELCALPREQRDAQLRALNETLLPNHAAISCGRGGFPGE
jgi:hypothetical protein